MRMRLNMGMYKSSKSAQPLPHHPSGAAAEIKPSGLPSWNSKRLPAVAYVPSRALQELAGHIERERQQDNTNADDKENEHKAEMAKVEQVRRT